MLNILSFIHAALLLSAIPGSFQSVSFQQFINKKDMRFNWFDWLSLNSDFEAAGNHTCSQMNVDPKSSCYFLVVFFFALSAEHLLHWVLLFILQLLQPSHLFGCCLCQNSKGKEVTAPELVEPGYMKRQHRNKHHMLFWNPSQKTRLPL